MIETADFDHTHFEDRQAGDRSVHARFYMKPVQDEKLSAENGRPMFKDVEYLEIRAPGNQNNIVNRPVRQMDRERFARQYHLFQAGHADQVTGTRLTEVSFVTKSQAEELAYLRVLTVEDLASLNDSVCVNVPGLHDLKRRAGLYLEQAEKAAPFTALQEENSQLKAQLASLADTVAEQTKLLKELQAKK